MYFICREVMQNNKSKMDNNTIHSNLSALAAFLKIALKFKLQIAHSKKTGGL